MHILVCKFSQSRMKLNKPEKMMLMFFIFELIVISLSDYDECFNSPCQNGGTCINTFGGYRCECNYGYSGQNCHLGKWKLGLRTAKQYTCSKVDSFLSGCLKT